MTTKTDSLFGRIAVNAGLVKEAQVEECIRIQQTQVERKPLGVIMLERGYVSEADIQKLIEIQRQNLNAQAVRSRERRADSMFGKLLLRFGFATEDQVTATLELQAQLDKGKSVRLGELMVERGFVTREQVDRVLDFQRGKQLVCFKCGTQYNAVLFQSGERLTCYKCSMSLIVP
ncbi:MAG: hypothetical protein RDV41_13045 [Planctomycetota bacterium]|nr:hypothetical protein [Planctomycetota bacterium]